MGQEEYTSEGLLSKLSGVTAVLDGHTHKVYNTTVKDKNGKVSFDSTSINKTINDSTKSLQNDLTKRLNEEITYEEYIEWKLKYEIDKE